MQSNQKTQTLSESSSVNVLTEIFIAFATEIVIANEKKLALGVSRFKIHLKKKIPEKNKLNKPTKRRRCFFSSEHVNRNLYSYCHRNSNSK